MSAPTISIVSAIPVLSGQYTGYVGSVVSESTRAGYYWASGGYTGALAADFTGIVGSGADFQRFTSTTNATLIALNSGFVQKVVPVTSSGTALFGFSVNTSETVTSRNPAYTSSRYDLKIWGADGIIAPNRVVFSPTNTIGTLAKTGSLDLIVNRKYPLSIIWNSTDVTMGFTRKEGHLYTDLDFNTFAGSSLISGQVIIERKEYRNGKTNQYYLQGA